MRRLCLPFLLVLSLLGSVALPACHAPSSVTTPAGKSAYTADQVVKRLGELEAAAIQANKTGGLADQPAVLIVKFCVDSARTLKEAPNGWVPTVSRGWQQLKRDVPILSDSKWAPYATTVDAVLASFGG